MRNLSEKIFSIKGFKFTRKLSFRKLNILLFLFQLISLFLVFFANNKITDQNKTVFAVFLIFAVFLSNIIIQKYFEGDKYIMLIATMLFSIGVIIIYRLNFIYGIRQMIWFSVGIISFYITYFILRFIKNWNRYFWFYIGLCFFLFGITLVFGKRESGAINWLRFGSFSFQPSEITKIAMIFVMASYYTNKEKYQKIKIFNIPAGKYILTLIIYVFMALLFIQRDLGTAAIMYGTYIFILYVYGDSKLDVIINLFLAIIGSFAGFKLFSHVRARVYIWLDPWKYIDDKGYQIVQSLFSIGSGGFFGTGIGLGKPDYIPLAHSDFIFASICEEMGIFIGIAVMMLFLIIVYRGYKISISQKNEFFKIVAFGITTSFALQAFIVIGGVIKFIPMTGATIPFLSYGGSSILSSFISLAVLQYTSNNLYEGEDL